MVDPMQNEFEKKLVQLNQISQSAGWSLDDLHWTSLNPFTDMAESRTVQTWVSQLYHVEMFAIESC